MKAFEGLRHIVTHGALVASGTAGTTAEMAEAEGLVDEDEAFVFETANAWIDRYNSMHENPAMMLIWEDTADLEARKAELEELAVLDPKTRARRVFAKQIDQLMETLAELRGTLGKHGAV